MPRNDRPFNTDEKVEKVRDLYTRLGIESPTDLYMAIRRRADFISNEEYMKKIGYEKITVSRQMCGKYYEDPATITWRVFPLLNYSLQKDRLLFIAADIDEAEWDIQEHVNWVNLNLRFLVFSYLQLDPRDQERLLEISRILAQIPKKDSVDEIDVHVEACERLRQHMAATLLSWEKADGPDYMTRSEDPMVQYRLESTDQCNAEFNGNCSYWSLTHMREVFSTGTDRWHREIMESLRRGETASDETNS